MTVLALLGLSPALADGRIDSLSGDTTGDEGETLSWTCLWSEDGDPVAWDWDLGDGTTTSSTTNSRQNSVSHSYVDEGTYTVECEAESDGSDDSDTLTVTIANVAPTLSGSPGAAATEGTPYEATFEVSDPGTDDVLTWSHSLPSGASWDDGSLTLSWTPTWDQEGDHGLTLTVDDGDGGSDTMSWTVTVAILDEDGDGLPDTWEAEHGLDPEDGADASADPDGDGRDNATELADGSDPQSWDGPSVPVLLDPIGGVAWTLEPLVLTLGNAESPVGSALTYTVEVYSDEALTDRVFSLADLAEGTDGETAVELELPLAEDHSYWWRAVASDGFVEGDPAAAESFLWDLEPDSDTGLDDTGQGDSGVVDTAGPDSGTGDTGTVLPTSDSGAQGGPDSGLSADPVDESTVPPDTFCGCGSTGSAPSGLGWAALLGFLGFARRRS